jgi:hypothetical protein
MPLPTFGFVCLHRRPLTDGPGSEAQWARRCAATGRAVAHLWQGVEGFVVPRRYTTLPGWPQRPRDLALHVRSSGGGLVPQGPGVWNLSLLWPVPSAVEGHAPSATPTDTTGVYAALCAQITEALARLGIDGLAPRSVEGSWCDGRFNLAAGGAKLVGTAQAWKRVAPRDGASGVPIVLAHAVIVVTADPVLLTERANACEAALGHATRYRADALTSVARCASGAPTGVAAAEGIESRTLTVLAEQFARIVEPHVAAVAEASPGAAAVRPA